MASESGLRWKSGEGWELLVGGEWCLMHVPSRKIVEAISAELSAAREMREVLRVTHQGVFQQWSQCPCCDNERSHNHAPDCRLARLIGGGE